MPTTAVRFSAIIPAFNAGDGFRHLLNILRRQEDVPPPEIIVVDSGSTDRTVAVAGECGARVIDLPQAEFSHSHARNLGAETASGDYLLFTVQDALPPSQRWLREMFMALRKHHAAAVSCAEYPRVDADLFYRAVSWNHNRFMGVADSDRVMRLPPIATPTTLRQNAQLSNTACLVSRVAFSHYRFRGSYAEDLDFGLRLIRDGHTLAFLGTTHIIHSHNRPASYYFKRGYVDTLTLRQMFDGNEANPCQIHDMLAQIDASRRALDGLLDETLDTLQLPCTPAALSTRVEADLANRSAERHHGRAEVTPDRYVDEPLACLLNELLHQSCPAGAVSGDADVMVAAVRGMSSMLLAYMSESYVAIDDLAIDEFKQAMYKGWALHSGGQLASLVMLQGGPSTESNLWLHRAMSRAV